MSRIFSAIGLALTVASGLAFLPSVVQAQKGLVYCPVSVDATGCGPIVTAIAPAFPDGVETAFDGSSGTIDLATADLSAYAVLVVPSLADGAGAEPYRLLRDGAIAGRLSPAFNGRNAVWSGTPDHGSTSRAAKDALLRNLAGWARSDAAAGRGPGIVVLQDNSDDGASRYGWLRGISGLSVVADTTFEVYSNVQVLTSTGRQLLTNSSGLQIGYTNMASYGLVASGGGSSNDATGGRTTRVVLVTMAGEASAPSTAVVTTDKEDYQPGDTISVTGAGWEPGETVSLLFHEDVDPPIHPDKTLTAVADADGHISNHQYEVEETDLGVRFTLVATGQTSGRTAQTTFTDGKVNTATIATFTANAAPPPLCTATAQSAFPAASQVCATATITDLSGNAGQNTDFFIVWLDRNDVVRRATQFTIPGGTVVSTLSPFVRSDALPTQSGGNQGPAGSTWKVKVCSNNICNGTGNTHASTN
ncbi:MAG TPA: hypothetical protein VK535_04870, partial [Gemmatimonadales bacterium]|nr:hypothetical protein [Gemmatimonadales bacterium]